MAFIPDEAIDRFVELSKGARLLYVFLARCRNQKTGRCFPSVATTQEALGVNRGTVFTLRRELANKGWARFDGDEVNHLFGFGSTKNQTADNTNKELEPSLKNQTVEIAIIEVKPSLKNQTDLESEKSDSKVRKIRLNSTKNHTAYKEEPAKEPAKITSKLSSASALAGSLSRQECFSLFCDLRKSLGGYEAPYQQKTGDFVRLDGLFKNCQKTGWLLTEERFTLAASHYFETPRSSHTLADLAANFSEFFKHPLDRFGKPVETNGNGIVRNRGKPTLAERNQAAIEEAAKILGINNNVIEAEAMSYE